MVKQDSTEGNGSVKETQPVDKAQGNIEETVRRLDEIYERRRFVFVVVFLTTFLGVQAWAFFGPAKYSAQAALLIQRTRLSSQLNTGPQDPPTIIAGSVSEEDVNSEIAILTSNDVLTATVRATGLGLTPPPWYLRLLFAPLRFYERLYASYHDIPFANDVDRAPNGLQRSITAKPMKDSNVLVVEYRTGDPRVAEIVLRELLKQYLDLHLAIHQGMQDQPFFDSQAKMLESTLEQYEAELHDLQVNIGAVDVKAEERIQLSIDGGLREEAAALSRRIAELGATIEEYDRIVDEATQSGGVLAAAPQRDSILDDFKGQALRLELTQIDLESRYASGFPLLEQNMKKLDATRQALADERRNIRDHSPTLAQVDMERAKAEAEKAGLIERMNVLDEQIMQSRDRLMELELTSMNIDQKRRRIKTVEERYTTYISRGEQARMNTALDQKQVTNVSVVQEPVASVKPVKPRKTIVLLTSVLGGILMGLLAGLWFEIREMGLVRLLTSIVPPEAAP